MFLDIVVHSVLWQSLRSETCFELTPLLILLIVHLAKAVAIINKQRLMTRILRPCKTRLLIGDTRQEVFSLLLTAALNQPSLLIHWLSAQLYCQ